MRKSSPAQLEIDYSANENSATQQRPAAASNVLSPIEEAASNRTNTSVEGTSLAPPPEIVAATARIAGRINAAYISDEEQNALLRERQKLLDKKFSGALGRRDANRLEYVRWSLDRIEDARYGFVLDTLENGLAQYEKLATDMQLLREQLDALLKRKR